MYNALGTLRDDVVFVGGATVSLYADRAAEEARPTEDVDILVEISSYPAFAQLEEQLREMGFKNDINAKFAGRYLHSGIVVDVMPIDDAILGFSNKWYSEGFKTSVNFQIDDQHRVKIFSAPYFIATKLEAFKSRGENDGRQSSDFEDIVFVLENRRTIWNEMSAAEQNLNSYLKEEFIQLLGNRYLEEWIDGHVNNPGVVSIILRDMNKFILTS